MNIEHLAAAILSSPHSNAARVHLETLPRGKHGRAERIASDDMPRNEDDALALLADWAMAIQAESDALATAIPWAVVFEAEDGSRLGRGPAQQARPAAAPGEKTAQARYMSDLNGANAILQTIVLKWSDMLPALQMAQARQIDAQTEALARAREREIDEIRVRERLASKEHEREMDMARQGSRQELQDKAINLLMEIKPLLGERAKITALRNGVAKLSDEQKAALAASLAQLLDAEAAKAALSLLEGDDDEEQAE